MIHPYRFFSGTCREAMTWYHDVLGGDLDIMGADEMPAADDAFSDVSDDFVMHADLVFDDGTRLMASDDPTGDGKPASGVALHVTRPTPTDGERVFEALARGGTIEMPFEEVFWALRFGACTDRFGTSWMVSVDHPDEANGASGTTAP